MQFNRALKKEEVAKLSELERMEYRDWLANISLGDYSPEERLRMGRSYFQGPCHPETVKLRKKQKEESILRLQNLGNKIKWFQDGECESTDVDGETA